MPKEGFNSITISDDMISSIEKFLQENPHLKNKANALKTAWIQYEKKHAPNKELTILDKKIGDNHSVFVIGEIGINHNGSLDICKKIIDMAVEAGCDAVKFQKRTPELCVPEDQKNKPKETPWGNMTYLEYKKKIEFGKEEFEEIDRYCKEKNILWSASPWDIPSVDFLEEFDIPFYKIPSAHLTNKELLSRIKQTGKPIIISTGMSTMEEVEDIVDFLGENNLAILHCNSSYPAKEDELNLSMIQKLKEKFNCPIGYSGHESTVYPSFAAGVLGASIIERHITIDRTMWGTDQSASLEKRGLGIICGELKQLKTWLGDGVKKIYDSEWPIREKLRGK